MLKGFKEFLARGNIVDLSVAVVIGAAFTTVVKSFTDGVVKPLVNMVGGDQKDNFSFLHREFNHQTFSFDDVVSTSINFVIVAAVVYFLVVLPYNTFRKRGEVEQADDAQIVLLTEIRDLLAQNSNGSSGKHGGVELSSPPDHGPRADVEKS
jgi:large conductance mechanosensitive channel